VQANCVRRSLGMVQRRYATWLYHGRISGPLMDRFDIHIDRRPRVDYEKLTSERLVPQAAQRADPDAGGGRTRRAARTLSRDQAGVQ
jgi:predicted ATPase with chaperone activity